MIFLRMYTPESSRPPTCKMRACCDFSRGGVRRCLWLETSLMAREATHRLHTRAFPAGCEGTGEGREGQHNPNPRRTTARASRRQPDKMPVRATVGVAAKYHRQRQRGDSCSLARSQKSTTSTRGAVSVCARDASRKRVRHACLRLEPRVEHALPPFKIHAGRALRGWRRLNCCPPGCPWLCLPVAS